MSCSFTILNHLGHPLARLSSSVGGSGDIADPELENAFVCEIEELPLVPGRYRIDVELRASGVLQDSIEGAVMFDVEEATVDGRPVSAVGALGDVVLRHRWIAPTG